MATSSFDLGVRGLRDVEVIGSGGSAVVYKAVREVPGRFAMQETVAVKVLRSSWDSKARRRFEREQRVMDRLADTAGFVPIVETGETDDGSPYIIMPFYDGGSLQERISRSGPVDWPRAVRLVEEVARTLQQAHELDVFHRDIKPANILLTESGRPHVADFGISLIADDAATRATSTAAFTPAYSPPESFTEGLMPVATTDIYGLGATLWATLAGHAPFKEPGEQPTPVTVFGRVAMHQVGDLREHVPSPICRFIERAMAKVPEDRPATMGDFLAELQNAREDAYRGVEAPRLDVTPLVDAGSARLLDGLSKIDGDGTDRDIETRSEEHSAGGVEGEASTVTIGVLPTDGVAGAAPDPPPPPAETGEVAVVTADHPVGKDPDPAGDDGAGSGDDGPVHGPAEPVGDVVEPLELPAESASATGGNWLVKVAAAAASTVLILLVAWWLLGSGVGSDATDDSLVIVAEGESAADAASSESGRPGGEGGGQSALGPVTTSGNGEVTSAADRSTAPPDAVRTATTRGGVTTRRAATSRPVERNLNIDPAAEATASSAASPNPGPPLSSSSMTTTATSASPGPTAESTSTTSSTPPTAESQPISIMREPSVVSATGAAAVFSYRTNDVCGTGSFEYTEADSGRSLGSWTGDRGCFGPVHFGETRWPGITLTPGTTYLVTIVVEGQPSNGTLPTGTGQATTSLLVTTPD